jgi:hypothetical protein
MRELWGLTPQQMEAAQARAEAAQKQQELPGAIRGQ